MELEFLYIEFGVIDFENINEFLGEQLSFKLFATRENDRVKQSVWEQGNIRFVTTKLKQTCLEPTDLEQTGFNDQYVTLYNGLEGGGAPSYKCLGNHGSVYNVAFRVNDVDAYVEHIRRSGGTVIAPVREVSDDDGTIRIAAIKSCIGNVVHTLVDLTNYKGIFLPLFDVVSTENRGNTDAAAVRFIGMDHLAFAIDVGHSQDVIEWYEKCFKMQRYYMSSQDSAGDGFVVNIGDIGLRLKAMSAEMGLMSCDSCVKFVLAESLHAHSSDQISTFIREHGGEGLQHIGLMTDDITACIARLSHNGVTFTEPPPTYYSQVGKLREMEEMGEDARLLEQHGILIDADEPLSSGYLMQKFTKPIFGSDTFFFEIIQRKKGSRGFGAGNVSALWKSFQAYLEQKESPTAQP